MNTSIEIQVFEGDGINPSYVGLSFGDGNGHGSEYGYGDGDGGRDDSDGDFVLSDDGCGGGERAVLSNGMMVKVGCGFEGERDTGDGSIEKLPLQIFQTATINLEPLYHE